MIENITHYKQASVKIRDCIVIYIDPWDIADREKADIILITHTHFDHLSPQDIALLRKPDTLVCVPTGAHEVEGKVKILRPGDFAEHRGIRVDAMPAYNINKSFHAKGNLWLGYVITVAGNRYYHAGDTDFIPEMKALKNIDVAFLPVGGTYTMDAHEAAEAANSFMPRLAIPIHYGDIVGSRADAEEFKRLCKCKVEII